MLETLKKALKVKEIRKRLLYTFLMLIVVRLGCQIPIPFVNADAISEIMNHFANENFSFFSAITGGSMEKMSIFALNITPYITASIIMQLLTIAIPKLDELHKDGEEGRKKIAEITRYLTVGLALIESTAMVVGFGHQGIFDTDTVKYAAMHDIRKWGVIVTGILAMTAGSAVLMWIGEQITEKGVGNGISIVLTINIISGIPSDISNLFKNFVLKEGMSIGGRLLAALIIIGVIVAIVVLVIILQDAIRKIAYLVFTTFLAIKNVIIIEIAVTTKLVNIESSVPIFASISTLLILKYLNISKISFILFRSKLCIYL